MEKKSVVEKFKIHYNRGTKKQKTREVLFMEAKDRVYQALCRRTEFKPTGSQPLSEPSFGRRLCGKDTYPAGMLEYQETTERERAGFCQ